MCFEHYYTRPPRHTGLLHMTLLCQAYNTVESDDTQGLMCDLQVMLHKPDYRAHPCVWLQAITQELSILYIHRNFD